jgi:glycosyltransferase involved in cell wall biosynthesis
MDAGGAERVLSTLAFEWVQAGHHVTLLTIADTGSDFYAVDPRVNRQIVGLASPSSNVITAVTTNVRRMLRLRRTIADLSPDVVISFVDRTNVRVLLSTIGLRVPVVVSERIDPRTLSPGQVWSALRSVSYRWASTLVVQTEAVAQWARTQAWQIPVAVIPNPVHQDFAAPADSHEPRKPIIVGMGRLTPQKGFDNLIRAFDRIAARCPEWSLVIAGEGPSRAALEAQASRTAVASRISLPGRLADPAALLRSARVFVLSSRFEGFPNVLLEAMASGCAVVSTDCPSGPAEILRDRQTGRLVPSDDVEALAAAMEELIANPSTAVALAEKAQARVRQFAPDRIAARWNEVLRPLLLPVAAKSVPDRSAAPARLP